MSVKVSLAYGRYYAIVVNRQLPPHYPLRKLLRRKDTTIISDLRTFFAKNDANYTIYYGQEKERCRGGNQ